MSTTELLSMLHGNLLCALESAGSMVDDGRATDYELDDVCGHLITAQAVIGQLKMHPALPEPSAQEEVFRW